MMHNVTTLRFIFLLHYTYTHYGDIPIHEASP